MGVMFRILTTFYMFLLVHNAEGMDCSIGQEPDPNAGNIYRWVIPVDDPCKCTRLRVGGLNTQTPCRHFNVTYYDTFLQSDNAADIRKWLGCKGSRLPPLILNRALGYRRNASSCHDEDMSKDYNISGNSSLVKMVSGPGVHSNSCAVYAKTGAHLDLGDFGGTCISDPDLCQSMTWSLWLKIDTSSGFTGERYYISSGGQTQKARGFVFLFNKNKFHLNVRTKTHIIKNAYILAKIPRDTWFHLAFTFNNVNDQVLQLFIDGVTMQTGGDTAKEHRTESVVDCCIKLYLGMTNSCDRNYYHNQYGGSAAYNDLMVFDGLLTKKQIVKISSGGRIENI